MTHPDPDPRLFNVMEKICRRVYVYSSGAVFTPERLFDGASKLMGHQLHAVADTKNRDLQLENCRIGQRSAHVVHARRPSREYNSLRLEVSDLFQGHIEGMDFTVDVAFPYPARNQLRGLRAEIQNQYPFLVQMI